MCLSLCIYILLLKNNWNDNVLIHINQFSKFIGYHPSKNICSNLEESINCLIEDGFIIKNDDIGDYVKLHSITLTDKFKDKSDGFAKLYYADIKKIVGSQSLSIMKMLLLFSMFSLNMNKDRIFYSTYVKLSNTTGVSERLLSQAVAQLKKLDILDTELVCKPYKQKDGTQKWKRIMLFVEKKSPDYKKKLHKFAEQIKYGQNNADENLW